MEPHLLEERLHFESNSADICPADAGIWIQIDAQLIRVVQIEGAYGVRMELDTAQVNDPCEPRRIMHDYLFRSTARRERERHSPQPRRTVGGRTLLIKRLALGAVNKALENDGTVLYSGQRSGRDREVVANDIQLRKFRLP